jgi:hypothetical protein
MIPLIISKSKSSDSCGLQRLIHPPSITFNLQTWTFTHDPCAWLPLFYRAIISWGTISFALHWPLHYHPAPMRLSARTTLISVHFLSYMGYAGFHMGILFSQAIVFILNICTSPLFLDLYFIPSTKYVSYTLIFKWENQNVHFTRRS